MPGLQDRLGHSQKDKGMEPMAGGLEGKATLIARVEALEDAYAALLQAQVGSWMAHGPSQHMLRI